MEDFSKGSTIWDRRQSSVWINFSETKGVLRLEGGVKELPVILGDRSLLHYHKTNKEKNLGSSFALTPAPVVVMYVLKCHIIYWLITICFFPFGYHEATYIDMKEDSDSRLTKTITCLLVLSCTFHIRKDSSLVKKSFQSATPYCISWGCPRRVL